jgi:hypothetical protein
MSPKAKRLTHQGAKKIMATTVESIGVNCK